MRGLPLSFLLDKLGEKHSDIKTGSLPGIPAFVRQSVGIYNVLKTGIDFNKHNWPEKSALLYRTEN